jgi:hypothetical protein
MLLSAGVAAAVVIGVVGWTVVSHNDNGTGGTMGPTTMQPTAVAAPAPPSTVTIQTPAPPTVTVQPPPPAPVVRRRRRAPNRRHTGGRLLRAQCQRLDDIGAAADPRVEQHRQPVGRLNHRRQAIDRG